MLSIAFQVQNVLNVNETCLLQTATNLTLDWERKMPWEGNYSEFVL